MHMHREVEIRNVADEAQHQRPTVPSRRLVTGATLIGMVVLAGLLGSFLLVVQGAVKRGESMRRTANSHADLVWRCNALPTPEQRTACRADADRARTVNAAPGTE